MKIGKLTALATASSLLMCSSGWADIVSLPLTDDAYISGDVSYWQLSDKNFGDKPDLFVHNYGPKHGLLRFDAATIVGQIVNSATLKLYLNSIKKGGTISVHAITSSWNESSVTWNNQPPAESTNIAVVSLTTSDDDSVINIDVTSLVSRWADGSLADAGLLVMTANGIKAFFDTKENAGGTRAALEVDTGPTPDTGEAIVLDFSDPDNCIIDEPGHYILDRSWDFSQPDPDGACNDSDITGSGGVMVTASDVTLDLRGFALRIMRPTGSDITEAVLRTNAQAITIVGGVLAGDGDAISGLNGELGTVTLKNMYINGRVKLRAGTVLNTHIVSGFSGGALRFDTVGSAAAYAKVVRDSTLICTYPGVWCLNVNGWAQHLEIRGNLIRGPRGMRIAAGGPGVIAGNIIDVSMAENTDAGIWAYVNQKTFAWNTILNDTGIGKGINLTGHVGIVEGNIVRGTDVGIFFNAGAGNFYGNNRVSATTPFYGHENQVDWGGNVSF